MRLIDEHPRLLIRREVSHRLPSEAQSLPAANTGGFVVGGIVFAVFCQCIFFDFVGWDDARIIAANPRYNPPTFESIWFHWTHVAFNLYQPLTYTLWAALAKIAKLPTPDPAGLSLNPFVFHLASVIFQTASAVAVYGILLIVTRSVLASVLGALVFAIHPLMIEPVAFIGSMNTPFAASLGLSAVWLYLSRDPASANLRSRARPAIAVTLYGLSLLAKPSAVTLPFLAAALEISALHRSARKVIIGITPWILITLPCLVWTWINQAHAGSSIPLWMHVLFAGHAAAFYLGKFAWPVNLTIDYGYTPRWYSSHPAIAFACVVPLALLGCAWWLKKRSPVVSAALVLYLILLLPNSGLASFDYQRISNVADRYSYLAMVAVALCIAELTSRIKSDAMRRTACGLIVGLLLLWVFCTSLQLRNWRNGIVLFTHAINVNPQSFYACDLLAQAELSAGDPTDALPVATRSIEINPVETQFQAAAQRQAVGLIRPPVGSETAWAEAAQSHVTRGNVLDELNRLNEAANEFKIAIRMNPANVIAVTDLAFVLGRSGHSQQALAHLKHALEIDPTYRPARTALQRISSAGSREQQD